MTTVDFFAIFRTGIPLNNRNVEIIALYYVYFQKSAEKMIVSIQAF